MSQIESADLEPVINELRRHRIKIGTDYAFVFKYHKLHVLCHKVYLDDIRNELRKIGVTEVDFHSFSVAS